MTSRFVQPELLDELPPTSPDALRSRRDINRINAWLGHARYFARALRESSRAAPLRRVADLGGGDGTFLLRVARRLDGLEPPKEVTLVDTHPMVSAATRDALRARGWSLHCVRANVLDWIRNEGASNYDILLANLFLHHCSAEQLRALFTAAAQRTRRLVAGEPARRPGARLGASLLWLLGCNHVTRHDARVSICAGFRGRELSTLWPGDGEWQLQEKPSGLFSHFFYAWRADAK